MGEMSDSSVGIHPSRRCGRIGGCRCESDPQLGGIGARVLLWCGAKPRDCVDQPHDSIAVCPPRDQWDLDRPLAL